MMAVVRLLGYSRLTAIFLQADDKKIKSSPQPWLTAWL
jgi:hypothetical protein